MTVTEAQKLYETAIRLVRVYAEEMPFFDADGDPHDVHGLAFEALLEQWAVPQVLRANVVGGVSLDDVGKLLRFFKDNCWDAIGAESQS